MTETWEEHKETTCLTSVKEALEYKSCIHCLKIPTLQTDIQNNIDLSYYSIINDFNAAPAKYEAEFNIIIYTYTHKETIICLNHFNYTYSI